MIFLTVGTQLPFDRLVGAVDSWAESLHCSQVVAQIGNSRLQPKNMDCYPFMQAAEFKEYFIGAEMIIAHAGMGTILTAIDLGKPVVIVPRLAQHGEHRNDHQLATVEKLGNLPLVHSVHDVSELGQVVNEVKNSVGSELTGSMVSESLLNTIRGFVDMEPLSSWPQAA